MTSHEESAELFSRSLLTGFRRLADESGIESDELPRWFRAADVRIAEVDGSAILLFERTPKDRDRVVEYRSVGNDVEFVFPGRSSSGKTCAFDIGSGESEQLGVSSIQTLSLAITNEHQTFTNIHQHNRHLSLLFFDVFLQYEPQEQIEAARYLPFALFLTPDHVYDFSSFWGENSDFISDFIKTVYTSPFAEYRSEAVAKKGILSSVDDTVIILGSYDGPHEAELRQIRDYLIRIGYDAFLIKDLPAKAEMSLEEKVKLWTTASRFCVMVDREASGHIKEYEMVKSGRKPLVLLRPEGGGSTWMIGDDELMDLNYIKTFRFNRSPLGAAEEGIQWAEGFLKNRGESYPDFYPWRTE